MRHSSYLEVNLSLLYENFQKIKTLSPAHILPMVKADAYGNGLIPVAQFLVNECQVKRLGCATLGEAINLFEQCPDLEAEAMIFSDNELTHSNLSSFYQHLPIMPVLHQRHEVELVLKNKEFQKIPIILKVDTGMNRLGLSLEDLSDLAPQLRGRGVKHLMTHFACSYYPLKKKDRTHRQMEKFIQAKKILIDAGVEVLETSVANSGAIEQKFGVDETYIRPGLMLYGPYSVSPETWQAHQVSRFVTKVIKTFEVKKGTPLGYGVNVAGEDGLVALIATGYADWSVTTMSGAELIVNGYPAKIFGRVNMDMAYLMFDPSVAGKIHTHDVVEIWNHNQQTIMNLSHQMKTIPYHLMCAVTHRIPKIYRVK